jgi:hypothetical protein
MKYFLLIAGENYYPDIGTEDWIATFETKEEAEDEIKIEMSPSTNEWYYGKHLIRGCHYDWYEIVDLRKWINEDGEGK